MLQSSEKANDTASPAADREIDLTRLFDAPREIVYRAWTNPEQLKRWWGPDCFTVPECNVEAWPGGVFHLVLRAPDGTEFPMTGSVIEAVEPERFVYHHLVRDRAGNALLDGQTAATFTDENGRTRLTLHSRAVALVPGAIAMLNGMEPGWHQTLERLAGFVAVSQT